MKHWSVDQEELKKDPQALAIWKLEQAVNFGLGDGKLKRDDLRTYWDKLDLDPAKKKFLELALTD